jgi:hypothetical protein
MGLMRGTASAIERSSAAVFQKEKGLARQKPSQALDFHGAEIGVESCLVKSFTSPFVPF